MATAPNEAKLQEFLGKAIGAQTPFNLILEARPWRSAFVRVVGGSALVGAIWMNASGTDAIRRSASSTAPSAHDSRHAIPEDGHTPCALPERPAEKKPETAFVGVCSR